MNVLKMATATSQINVAILVFLLSIKLGSCFFVQILNISTCDESDTELGKLQHHLTPKHPFDQDLSAKIELPVDLDMDAVLEYRALIWDEDDEEWEELYTGERSVCRSLVKSLDFQMFARETGFPNRCPIREGKYEINDYPVSGQYVVFNTVRGVNPLVKHRLRLLQDELPIFCRIIYTMSHEV